MVRNPKDLLDTTHDVLMHAFNTTGIFSDSVDY